MDEVLFGGGRFLPEQMRCDLQIFAMGLRTLQETFSGRRLDYFRASRDGMRYPDRTRSTITLK
jgi:hypothetical protein